ncbi:DNA-binding CsgD family transcriptional regulator [Rhodococcus sp. 27YEA15]|uniref:LuxR C-terminal-related transcriptional regulator n=1 Tax=Rhodococcus sp. 27YEA15 TaxID=3156259 RepID=UPI003C7CDD02
MELLHATQTVQGNLVRIGHHRTVDRVPRLSPREIEVLLTWLRSDTKRDAAQKLGLGIGTINTHITRIRTKYNDVGRPASTKSALFARAIQDGHTTLDQW